MKHLLFQVTLLLVEVKDLRNSPFKDQILKEFKSHFKLQVKEVTPANITLSEHGRFLRLTMEKLKDKS